MNFDATINGKHYTEYLDYLEKQIADGFLNESKILLIKIISKMENYSLISGEPVAPAYYKMLAKIYKKEKNTPDQLNTLLRYLTQIKARGVSAKKIYDEYLKLTNERADIYSEYKKNLTKCKAPIFKYTCPHCKNKIDLVKVFNTATNQFSDFIGVSCPNCFESFITE